MIRKNYLVQPAGTAGFFCGKKKNPDKNVGGPNQKPLTIKPYPMKIHR